MNAIMTKKFTLLKDQKGMTLIELLAVVVILGILAAVAGAAVMGAIDKSKTQADESSIAVIQDAAQRYVMDNPTAALADVGMDDLISEGYLKEQPKDSAGKYFTLSITLADKVYTYTVTGGQAGVQTTK